RGGAGSPPRGAPGRGGGVFGFPFLGGAGPDRGSLKKSPPHQARPPQGRCRHDAGLAFDAWSWGPNAIGTARVYHASRRRGGAAAWPLTRRANFLKLFRKEPRFHATQNFS